MFVSNDPVETEEMQQLCAALLPSGADRDVPLPADGVQIEGQMLAFISPEYLQAIAKIGFHFFLQYFTRFSGLEPEFDAIKRFIYLGEADTQRVSVINENFILNLRNATLRQWSHLLSAQADENGIEAMYDNVGIVNRLFVLFEQKRAHESDCVARPGSRAP